MKITIPNRTLACAVAAVLSATAGNALATGNHDQDSASKDTAKSSQISMHSATLEVEDQTVSNDTVVIKDVYLPSDGYLVIHQARADGTMKAPESIGHTILKKGQHKAVKVELEASVESGDKLFAMLHNDTGKHGHYEFAESEGKSDDAMKADGKPVIKPFVVD